jgi:hypothetical protein
MKRRLFNLLAIASLVLFVIACMFWLAGRKRIEGYSELGERFGWRVYAGGGRVVAMWYFGDDRTVMVPRPYTRERLPLGYRAVLDARQPGADIDFGYAGFRFVRRRSGLSNWMVAAPYWFLCLVFACLPAWRAVAERRRLVRERRQRRGLCPRCGYDLRATPGKCPECGQTPAGVTA